MVSASRPTKADMVSRDAPVSLALDHWTGAWPEGWLESPATLLFCFPFAGAGTSVFHDWPALLPPNVRPVPIHLPGREDRWLESPYTDCLVLVSVLAEVLRGVLRPPFALFGHSMGAVIAFELARALRRGGLADPVRLFVSACRAPHLPDPDPPIYSLPDSEFISELRRLNGVPPDVLRNMEFMEMILPLLRADFRLCDTYRHQSEEPLHCPITAFGGSDDRKATPEQVRAWAGHTRGRFVCRVFPGDHFFVRSSKADLLSAITEDLRRT
jgi:medium-chain acyl-[acyl-carrier-protein] hydrolase